MSELEEIEKIDEVDNIEDLKDYIIKLEDRIEILEEFKEKAMVIFKELNKFMNKLEGEKCKMKNKSNNGLLTDLK